MTQIDKERIISVLLAFALVVVILSVALSLDFGGFH